MGFLVSRLYREQATYILVLKIGFEKEYAIIDEFFKGFLSRFRSIYRFTNEYIEYHKITERNRVFTIVEMHDGDHSDLFWDCLAGMNSIIYFIHSLTSKNIHEVIGQVRVVRDTNTDATFLVVVINTKTEMEEYTQFRRGLSQVLEGASYKIIDSIASTPYNICVQKEDVHKGLSWILD